MPREKEGYRDILADLLEFFGGKRVLTAADVSAYTGLCRRTAATRYGITKEGITVHALARKLCG